MQFVAQSVPGSWTTTEKAQRPYVERLCRWMSSWWRLAECRWHRDATSEIGVQQSIRYYQSSQLSRHRMHYKLTVAVHRCLQHQTSSCLTN